MDDRLKILLEDVITAICRCIPKGYRDIGDDSRELGDIERVLKTVYSSPVVPSGKFSCTIKKMMSIHIAEKFAVITCLDITQPSSRC